MSVNELFTSVTDGKDLIVTAITDKGVSSSGSDTFSELANKIENITTHELRAGDNLFLSKSGDQEINDTAMTKYAEFRINTAGTVRVKFYFTAGTEWTEILDGPIVYERIAIMGAVYINGQMGISKTILFLSI